MMLKGLTVWYLIKEFIKFKEVKPFCSMPSWGVGLIACQWLKSLGVKIIGTVGSDEKAKLAKKFGCAHTINYNSEKFKDKCLKLPMVKKYQLYLIQ